MAVYDAFYGFALTPFSISPDPHFFYSSARHREAFAGLAYAISQRKGFAVLTGEVGTGKTTVVHTLLTHLGERARSAFIFNPSVSPRSLYRHLLSEFGLPEQSSAFASRRTLQAFLLEQLKADVCPVVVLDEAHALSADVLEEVRLLANFETSQHKLLQVLLVGQPELWERLGRPELRQLRQRLTHRFELLPFSFPELIDYVRSRLVIAGRPRELFAPGAYTALHRFSGGCPRLINILCDNALLSGFAREHARIRRRGIYRAADSLGLQPVQRVAPWERLRARYRPFFDAAGTVPAASIVVRGLEVAK